MELDVVIRGGLVVDGSGAPAAIGDVGVAAGRIVAVGQVDGRGVTEIDAEGHVVAPGFVDAHTHMDAQVFWDDLGAPSCWQGVTTAVTGNCGFTLAPSRAEDRALVSCNLERAEDIPAFALSDGVPWNWTTFADYMDAVDALPKGINYAQAIGHSALRIWAMGERAFDEVAGPGDLATMARELRSALRAGAIGFSTSRNRMHETSDDRPVASRAAEWSEVAVLVAVLGEEGRGCFGDAGQEAGLTYEEYVLRLRALSAVTGVPVLLGAAELPSMGIIEATQHHGGEVWGLTHARGIGALQSFETSLLFDDLDGWRELRSRPLDEQRVLLRDPEVRARLVRAAHEGEYATVMGPFTLDFEQIQILFSAYLPNPSVAQVARERGVDPVEAMIDVALERDLAVFFRRVLPGSFYVQPESPEAEDTLLAAIRSPIGAMSFSDTGAHVSQIADASIQTHLLAYWVRERGALSLEEAVRSITSQPANAWRLHDRGLLEPGLAADITIFDLDTVAPLLPEVVDDLPGGGHRLEQRATGFLHTIVNGEVFTDAGEPTGVRAGRLLRTLGRAG